MPGPRPGEHWFPVYKPLQVFGERLHRFVTIVRQLLQTLQTDLLQIGRDGWVETAWCHRSLGFEFVQRFQQIIPFKGCVPGQHVIQRGAQAVDIDGTCDFRPFGLGLFGRQIAKSPDQRAGGSQ